MKCIHCGKELTTFNVVDENDNPVCDDCFIQYYEYCNNCRRAIPKGNGLCQSCSDVVFKKILNSYSTKVTNIFGNKKTDNIKCLNNRYFGLEMEYNYFSPSVARVLFKEQYDNRLIYNKSDSSISSGVEIVTIPLVKSRLFKLIDDMNIKRIKSYSHSYGVESNAGLHIHVSRNTITPIAVHRLSILFNSEWASMYKKYIYYLSGRLQDIEGRIRNYDDHYYEVGDIPLLMSMEDINVNSHSVAINLGNKHTVEFRLFKATRNPEQLKSYIEFTELAIQFAETQPLKLMTIPNFMIYLRLNATNEWLKDKLDYIYKLEPDLFKVREKKFTYDYYISKFKDVDEATMYNMINDMNNTVHYSKINWDVEKIDYDLITKWQESSRGKSIRNKKILDSLLNEIKRRTVEKILAK